MALTAPQSLSLLHGAIRPRGVYLSGPDKVFAVWSIYERAGQRFAAKPHDGAAGSEFILPVASDIVRDFDVAALTSDRAAVVYSNGYDLKYFVYDFVSGTLVLDTTYLSKGANPAMTNDGKLRTTYLKDNIVKMITDLAGDAVDLVESPAYALQGQNIGVKSPYIVYYLGAQSGAVDLALPVRPDINSVLVHDCRDTPTPVAQADQSIGLVAYYKMDDDAADDTVWEETRDVAGNGSLKNANTEDISAPAKLGNGLQLNGTSHYIDCGSSAVLYPPHVTVGGWFKFDSLSGQRKLVSRTETGGYQISMNNGDTNLRFMAHNGSGYTSALWPVSNLNTADPFHILGRFDGSNVDLIVNGVVQDSQPMSGSLSKGSNKLLIGAEPNASGTPTGDYFSGIVDDIRVYNYAVPDAIIVNDIVNGGAGSEAPPPYSDLLDYSYDDKSGNGHTLYVGNGLYVPGRGFRFGYGTASQITYDVPLSFITLESLFIPYGTESRGRMLDGELFMGYDAWGRVYWGYVDGATTHLYRQTALTGVGRARLNHVAVTHRWGFETSTELSVNGLLVPGEWAEGTGDTDPALGQITSTVNMGVDDLLVQLSVNAAAKSNADIEDYVKGRL